MGTSLSLTRSTAPNTQGIWGLRQETGNGDSSLGVSEGEPTRTEEAEACEQSILSMVVYEFVELGVEKA
jgi:hypothetical protein